MHEMSLMDDLFKKIKEIAAINQAEFVSKVAVEIGALAHISPDHFREHFVAFQNTPDNRLIKSASLSIVFNADIDHPRAQDITLLSIDVATELPDRLPTDIEICQNCLAALQDPKHRLYQYPLISCQDCGPRYTITYQAPFERDHTSMRDFELCEDCKQQSPQYPTLCCPQCGPRLSVYSLNNKIVALSTQDPIQTVVEKLNAGHVIAIKSIGGYHLICLAKHEKTVKILRERKHSPEKPFAIMRPQTAIQHLIAECIQSRILITSANIYGEPILYDFETQSNDFKKLADYCLTHDRKIVNPLDDSILSRIAGQDRLIRLGVGKTPYHHELPTLYSPAISLGGQLKNNIGLLFENTIQLSGYIGDLHSNEAMRRFETQFSQFLNDAPDASIIADKHVDYSQTASRLPKISFMIQHHLAHLFSVTLEHNIYKPFLGFAWDGLGLGEEGGLWGCETFSVNENKQIQHVATLHPIELIGSTQAIKEPLRIAIALLEKTNLDDYIQALPIPEAKRAPLLSILSNPKLSPSCTSMGRLFDGIAYLLGGPAHITYEGQAAIYLEHLATQCSQQKNKYPIKTYQKHDQIVIDWRDLLSHVIDDIKTEPSSVVSYLFHEWCSDIIVKITEEQNHSIVILSGGVFQNKILAQLSVDKLKAKGYLVYLNEKVPMNDGGLAFGQLGYKVYMDSNTCA